MELKVTGSDCGSIPVLSFEGELDGVHIDDFEHAVLAASRSASSCVIVDLGKVTYIDSRGFGRLVKVHTLLEAKGGDIAIVVGGTDVARLVHTFGGDYLLAVFDDVDSAAAFLHPLTTDVG